MFIFLQGLTHFDEILQEADGVILSRGNLGIDLPPEKVGNFIYTLLPNQDIQQVFLFQKAAVYKCNMAGKPAVVTRVVDSMTDNLRPTRAEATDVANAILDGIARQSLIVRGLFPMLADPRHPAESTNATNESVLKVALDHGKASGLIKSHDRVVVCQKVGDASVVKIIELED
ncbi:hypothetical protein BHM03_00042859 [Ensete ventricosum]|nr:hypothetical protein BHM03_00042859 [Ensete ventricosum]